MALLERRPQARFAIIERESRLGGNHLWCFHARDVPDEARPFVDPLVAYRWPAYEVVFPNLTRHLDLPYAGITSDQLHQVVTERIAAMNNLVAPEHLSRWHPKRIQKEGFSCSTFMLYLGVDKLYDIPHHNIYFSADYEQNVREIASAKSPSADPSFYVHNPSRLDPTMAPAGKSALYVLVPVPNNRSGINWDEEGPRYRQKVLDLLETRANLTDLRKHIVVERMITPADWANDMCVYEGATPRSQAMCATTGGTSDRVATRRPSGMLPA